MAKSAASAVPAPIPTIEGNAIRRDGEGRYSLNDLHKAAIAAGKANESQRPGNFLKADSVQAFIAAYEAEAGSATKIALVKTINGGVARGTYADELIAIRYAAWIDPSFEVKVYRTFQAAAQQSTDWMRIRHSASATNKAMNAVLQAVRQDAGKESSAHHYINEALLVNEALSGKRIGLDRNTLTAQELDLLAYLESRNTAMIGRCIPYKERKSMIAQLATAWKFEHTMPKLAP